LILLPRSSPTGDTLDSPFFHTLLGQWLRAGGPVSNAVRSVNMVPQHAVQIVSYVAVASGADVGLAWGAAFVSGALSWLEEDSERIGRGTCATSRSVWWFEGGT
jgi:hypothetical protein